MKNPYKKAIKSMDKGERVIVSRADDRYYVCDGYIALDVPQTDYDLFFRPEKPYFQQLEDHQTLISYKSNRKEHPFGETKPEYIDQTRFWPDDTVQIHRTPYKRGLSEGQADLFATTSFVAGVNSAFVDALDAAIPDATLAGTSAYGQLVWTGEDTFGLALPVRTYLIDGVVDALINEYAN